MGTGGTSFKWAMTGTVGDAAGSVAIVFLCEIQSWLQISPVICYRRTTHVVSSVLLPCVSSSHTTIALRYFTCMWIILCTLAWKM